MVPPNSEQHADDVVLRRKHDDPWYLRNRNVPRSQRLREDTRVMQSGEENDAEVERTEQRPTQVDPLDEGRTQEGQEGPEDSFPGTDVPRRWAMSVLLAGGICVNEPGLRDVGDLRG